MLAGTTIFHYGNFCGLSTERIARVCLELESQFISAYCTMQSRNHTILAIANDVE